MASATHIWIRCKDCNDALKECVREGDEFICEGCDPIRFYNIRDGKPLKIQKPSQGGLE